MRKHHDEIIDVLRTEFIQKQKLQVTKSARGVVATKNMDFYRAWYSHPDVSICLSNVKRGARGSDSGPSKKLPFPGPSLREKLQERKHPLPGHHVRTTAIIAGKI